MGVYLMGVYVTDVHLIGVHFIGVYLISVHFMGVYLIGVYLTGVHLISDVNSPPVPYLDPQYRTGHPCTRTSPVQYFLIRGVVCWRGAEGTSWRFVTSMATP
jgi:hypothetical protein